MGELESTLNLRGSSSITGSLKESSIKRKFRLSDYKQLPDNRLTQNDILDDRAYKDILPNNQLIDKMYIEMVKEKAISPDSKTMLRESKDKERSVETLIGTVVELDTKNALIEIERDNITEHRLISVAKLRQHTKARIEIGDLIKFICITKGLESFSTIAYAGRSKFPLDPDRLNQLENKYKNL